MKLLQGFWKLFKKSKKEKIKSPEIKKISEAIELALSKLKTEPTAPIRKKSELVHIQVGLDFGTSSTKVMYSQLGKRGRRVVNFDHGLPHYPDYCLPSLAAIDDQRNLLLGIDAARYLIDKEWDSGFQRFKSILAGMHDNIFLDKDIEEKFIRYRDSKQFSKALTPDRLTAIYLAYTIILIKNIIQNSPEYRKSNINFAFNICMPIEYIENNKVAMAFSKTFALAEAMSNAWIKLGKQFDPVNSSPSFYFFPCEQDKRVFSIPEAVAEIAAYLISLRREDGIHSVIDLGAGTTDVSICNLVSPGGISESLWYAARNIPKGMIEVEKLIASYIKVCNENSTCSCEEVYKILDKFTDHKFLTNCRNQKEKDLYLSTRSALNDIKTSKDYFHTWGSAYNHLRKQSKWSKDNVEIFITGGGTNISYAQQIFSAPWWDQIKGPYRVSKLPKPEDYDGGDIDAPFERMTVAYGLSYPKPMLEKYTLPKDAPDQTPPKIKYEWMDRDEKYAK